MYLEKVAPHAGAGIEIGYVRAVMPDRPSRPPRGGGN